MAYAKFVTRLNREGKQVSYGPYYYRSVRTKDGRVRNIYLGTSPANGNGKVERIKEILSRLAAS
jgi:hypothetical protein